MGDKYTQESFETWLRNVPTQLKQVVDIFAKEHAISLDFSIESLDTLEKWILKNYDVATDLRDEADVLDSLGIYIGETYMKYIGGKWFVDSENDKNVYYQHIVMKYEDGEHTLYRSAKALCTSSITRKKGNLISSTLRKSIEEREVK